MASVYPTALDYNLAVSQLDRFTNVPELGGAVARRKPTGQLFAIAGGFSRVYPVTLADGRKMALRVWTREVEHAQRRYQQIAQSFALGRPDCFVPVEYHPQGLLVNNAWWDLTLMEWVEAPTLSQWLAQYVHEARWLRYLAARFLEMSRELHSLAISHGDVQDGNILVVPAATGYRLVYIDYDTLHLPSMGTHNTFVLGVANYQHPRRGTTVVGRTADHFSELVVYLSLLAYAEKPTLWQQAQDTKLLFSERDYSAPDRSAIFQALVGLSPDVQYLAAQLRAFCAAEPNTLPPLETVVAGMPSARPTPSFDDWVAVLAPPQQRKNGHGGRAGGGTIVTPPVARQPDNLWDRMLEEAGTSKQQRLTERWGEFMAAASASPTAPAAPSAVLPTGAPAAPVAPAPQAVPTTAPVHSMPQAIPTSPGTPQIQNAQPPAPVPAPSGSGGFDPFPLLLLALAIAAILAVLVGAGVIVLPSLLAAPTP